MSEKDYKLIIGIFDTISKEIRNRVLNKSEEGKPLGVGVYTDECCDTKLYTYPMKSLDHRMQIAQGLSGVAFTFPVDSLQPNEIEKAAEVAYEKYLNEVKQKEEAKKYKAGFVIGSFDLLHAGHIENINLASTFCEDLYVVVKTDERIFDRKKKHSIQNTTERAEILRALKQVKGVVFYDLDSNRDDVIRNIIDQYQKDHPGETIEQKDLVAIFGEDLKEKEEKRKRDGDWGEVNIEITPRYKEKMKKISSSVYKKIIQETGGLQNYEKRELDGLVDDSMDFDDDSIEDEGHNEEITK